MRKSVSPLPGDEGGSSAQGTRVFGVPLEEVTRTHTISGLPVPALVKHIVDYIEEHGDLDVEGVFLVNGNAERVEWLRRRLDSGEPVQLQREADLASAVSLLRLFLQELPEPVIPQDVQRTILLLHQESGGEEEQCRRLRSCLQQLPQVNYGLLRFLCRFLSSVASLQQESWNVGTLAQVFGPDIFHLSTEAEDVREQESVSRVLAELLDNQEGLFDSEEDDVSTTNDYSSINEQITELLDDDKCEAECEDLPQDGEDGSSQSPQPSPTANTADSSHLSPISILPADSAQIIQETIRAAVEHHFLELKTSIDQDLRSYTNQGDGASEACGRHGDGGQQTERGDVLSETPAQDGQKDEEDIEFGPEESSRMDLDQNILNTARQDNQTCDIIEETDNGCCDLDPCQCDQNANTSETNRNHLSPYPPHSGSTPQLQLFPDNQWEAWPPPHAHLPPIDFSCMHLQKEGQDPVPAYKSWQEESESGEAQLSPLAGRMVPLPPLLLPPEEGGEAGEEGEEGEEGAAFEGERDVGPEMSPSSSARAHPHLLARRFLDFGAHSAQRFLQQDPDSTSPTKAHSRPRRASFGSKEAMRGGDAITHQLTKKLQHLKKKIKQFEEQFEKDRNYKPSHGDKAANPKVLKWMTDLTKIRRQIKEAKQRAESELGPQTRPRSNTLPKSFGSTLDQPPRPAPSASTPSSSSSSSGAEESPRPSREETAELIQKRVRGKRQDDCWPDDIKKMTKEQLSSEKTVLQKNLLHYEGIHGRPVTREERLVMKPLYDRYRLVKQMLTRVTITPVTVSPSSKRRTQTLQPIIEGETAHFWEEIREEEEEEAPQQQQQTAEQGGGDGEETEDRQEEEEEEEEEEEGESSGGETPSPDVIMITNPLLLSPGQEQQPPHGLSQGRGERIRSKSEEEGSGKLAMDLRLSSSNANSMPELLEQLWKTRAEKKQLRKTIRQFEEDFYQHNGRNVQKEDRLPMLEEYKEYKRIKAKLRLLEVLISKQDSSKSI